MIAGLTNGRLDMAFVTEPVANLDLTCLPLCTYRLQWIASPHIGLPKTKLSIATVAKWPIITHLRHTKAHATVQSLLARDGIPDARVYTSSSISTTLKMVVDGIGIGIIPVIAVEQEIDNGSLMVLNVAKATLPAYKFVAAYPRDGENYLAATVARVASSVAYVESRQ
jgi:DNA-binding transcriptional LysR family regulator